MKLLFITDKYWPRPLANAICMQNVADSFIEKGHSVDVLAFAEAGVQTPSEYHGAKIYTVPPSHQLELIYYARNFPNAPDAKKKMNRGLLLSRAKHALLLPWFPLSSIRAPKRVEAKIEELYSINKYDIVISVFSPFEAAVGGLRFKEKHPECFWCLYTLDTFVNISQTSVPECLRDAHYWIPRFLAKADMFICMKSRVDWYISHGYSDMGNGVFVTDIPLLTKEKALPRSECTKRGESWVYAGSLCKTHYDTTDLLKIADCLSHRVALTIHIYSSGNEAEELKGHPLSKDGKIAVHSYVDHDELLHIFSDADVLLSLKSSDQISAKIFEYMAYGKPVLHISSCEKDPNSNYIAKYNKGLVVHAKDESTSYSATKIEKWIKSGFCSDLTEEHMDQFGMNKPDYTRDLILAQYDKWILEGSRRNIQ